MLKSLKMFLIAALAMSVSACDGGGGKSSIIVSTLSGTATLAPGDSVELVAKEGDKNVTADVTFIISRGADMAAISLDKEIKINTSATVGAEIDVRAMLNNRTSDPLTLTVKEVKATALALTATPAASNVLAGSQINLSVAKTPVNATDAIGLTLTEGADSATLTGSLLKINDDAASQAVVKVKATAGTVQSNELSFTVVAPSVEAKQISLSTDNVVIDVNSTSAYPVVNYTVWDNNFVPIANPIVVASVESGSQYLSLDGNGRFVPLGHGSATVRYSVSGTEVYADCAVEVIVPPNAINLPAMLNNFASGSFSFGRFRFNEGRLATVNDDLDFQIVLSNSSYQTAAQDFVVKFEKNGVEDALLATYDAVNKKIRFNESGAITVVVESLSGSRREFVRRYTINVNDGINAYNFDDFRTALDCGEKRNDVIPNPDRLVCANYANYDADSLTIVNLMQNISKQRTNEATDYIFLTENTIQARGNVAINGNNYTVDLSRVIEGGDTYSHFIIFENNVEQTIKIKDLRIVGGCDASGGKGYKEALRFYSAYDSTYDYASYNPDAIGFFNITISNSYFSGFGDAIAFRGSANALIENSRFPLNYEGHIYAQQADVEVKDNDFGYAGVAAVTLGNNNSGKAGRNFDKSAEFKVSGQNVINNYHSLTTPPLMAGVAGISSSQIFSGLLSTADYGALPPSLAVASPDLVKLAHLMSHVVDVPTNIASGNPVITNLFIYKADGIERLLSDLETFGGIPDLVNDAEMISRWYNHYQTNLNTAYRNYEQIDIDGMTMAQETLIKVNGRVMNAIYAVLSGKGVPLANIQALKTNLFDKMSVKPERFELVAVNMRKFPNPATAA